MLSRALFLYPLPIDKFLDRTKLKAFANNELNAAVMMISLFDKSRKHCVKRRKCWLPFTPFPTVFSKASFLRVINSQDCVVNI